jgi:FtsP/CotA-like multicopper oxidase with cupredoxin domain
VPARPEPPTALPGDAGGPPRATGQPPSPRRRFGTSLAAAATALVLGAVGWFWWTSLVPATYSVMAMGYVDAGGGPTPGAHMHDVSAGATGRPGDVSVAGLTGPADAVPDVAVSLTAAGGPVTLPDGTTFDGYTLDGRTPGPGIEATQGDLVEVTLVNESVPDGVTLHWHGVDVPNAEDGVAGVTQDAVPPGGRHVYRFVVEDAGTYWYHSHQVSHRQVRLGLFGSLVVHPAATGDPAGGAAADTGADTGDGDTADITHGAARGATDGAAATGDVVVMAHTYGSTPTLDGASTARRAVVAPGEVARVRVINTNSTALRVWVAGAAYRLLALDGRDLHEPTAVDGEAVLLAAGGRADLEVVSPPDGSAAHVRIGGGPDVVVGPPGAELVAGADVVDPGRTLDLLGYGSPAELGLDPARPDRTFRYAIGRRFGFVDGRPGLHWTINGGTFPDVPMFTVTQGDVVRMTISNGSGQSHPMHLHGHHVVVLARDGTAATGSPWWTDSLEVRHGETYDVAFVADNPGVWMDHCHNLPHAEQGLVAHLMYTGVTSPFTVGGPARNAPE